MWGVLVFGIVLGLDGLEMKALIAERAGRFRLVRLVRGPSTTAGAKYAPASAQDDEFVPLTELT